MNEAPGTAHNKNNFTNELNDEEIASKRGEIITVPGTSENGKTDENTIPIGWKSNLPPNPIPNFVLLLNTDFRQTCKLMSHYSFGLTDLFFLGLT